MSRAVSFARLCALNLGFQVIWGAILGVSLQARTIALSPPHDAIARYSLLAAAGALVATIVQLVAGRASDRSRARDDGRRRFYAVGIGLGIPALVGFFFASTFAALAIAFVALEFALNLAIGPYQAIIPDYVPVDRRGRASAWMSAYQSLGNAAGLVLAGLIVDLHVVAAALALPALASYVVSDRHVRNLDMLAGTATAAPVRSRDLLGTLMLSRGAINVGFFALLDYLLFFVRMSLGVRADAVQSTTAFLFLTFTLCAIVGSVVAAGPTDRHDKRLVVTIAMCLLLGALAGLASATTLPIAYASAALAGAAWGAFVTADWALATAILPAGGMATAMGVWNVATTLPQIVAPLVASPLVVYANAQRAGSGPRVAIVFSMVAFAAGAATIWRLPRV